MCWNVLHQSKFIQKLLFWLYYHFVKCMRVRLQKPKSLGCGQEAIMPCKFRIALFKSTIIIYISVNKSLALDGIDLNVQGRSNKNIRIYR